jgi:hypothetical protein
MTKRTRLTFGVAGLVVALAAVFLWFRAAPGEAPPNQPAVVSLDSTALQALKADFNRDVEAVRLIVLLSPT